MVNKDMVNSGLKGLIKNESHITDSRECAGGNDCIGAPPVHNLSSVGAGVPTVGQQWTSVYSSQHLPRPAHDRMAICSDVDSVVIPK